MQKGYRYALSAPVGRGFDVEFALDLTPGEMLRLPDEDRRQIKRWKAIRRHVRQIERNSEPGDLLCRKRQRQALLHWAYDSRKI